MIKENCLLEKVMLGFDTLQQCEFSPSAIGFISPTGFFFIVCNILVIVFSHIFLHYRIVPSHFFLACVSILSALYVDLCPLDGQTMALISTFVFLALNIIIQLVYLYQDNERTVLFVGTGGAGKTTLAWGLTRYYSTEEKFSAGTDMGYSLLHRDLEQAWANGNIHAKTDDGNANVVRFSLNSFFMEKNFAFYDFGGEQIAEANPIIRGQNDLSKALLENTSLTFGAAVNMDVERTSIKHVLFLIGPKESGAYPHPDTYTSLQENIALVQKLTMRTANARRDKNYSIELRKKYHTYRQIKVHCLFTKYSRSEEPAQDQSVRDLLKNISPDLYRIVKDTKGKIRYVNVRSEDLRSAELVGVADIAQALMK